MSKTTLYLMCVHTVYVEFFCFFHIVVFVSSFCLIFYCYFCCYLDIKHTLTHVCTYLLTYYYYYDYSLPSPRSGALEVGDHIRAINGTATDHLNQNEANSLLRNSGNVINLEIEFDAPQESDVDTLKKTTQVRLKRERNGFGFTISGGRLENRPITVSNVIVGSYPYKYVLNKQCSHWDFKFS